MLNIIIGIVGALLLIVGLAAVGIAKSEYEDALDEYEDRKDHGTDAEKPVYKTPKKIIPFILLGLAAILFSFSITTIPS